MSQNQKTKDRLLSAACEVFAEKGFRDATVAEICEKADANIAAINYHFGDKEKLYDNVWRHAFALTSETYPLEGRLSKDPTLKDYLHSYASAILHRIFSDDATGLFAKLLHREMASPTLALDRIAEEALLPQSQYLKEVIQTVLGKEVDEHLLRRCKHSIIGQCAFYNFSRPLRKRVMGKNNMTEEEIEKLAQHIATFSLGGLKEIQK